LRFARGYTTAIVALAMGLLGSCATFAPPPRVEHEPRAVSPLPFTGPNAPVALVLSGGAARGFAHVGVLRVLEENGLKPDLIVGSSAGSIVGALYASGLSAEEVDAALAELSASAFTDFVLPRFAFLPGELGLVKGERLRKFVEKHLPEPLIERFPIRFAAVATDLASGEAHAFHSGDASLAVRASTAVPGILTPVEIGGRRFADGQIASPLPTAIARQLGAHIVIAVDVIYPPQHAVLGSPLGVVFQAFVISTHALKSHEARDADVIIEPAIAHTPSQFGLAARRDLVEAGERAAREALPRIRAKLGKSP
jgi:NTE family protein